MRTSLLSLVSPHSKSILTVEAKRHAKQRNDTKDRLRKQHLLKVTALGRLGSPAVPQGAEHKTCVMKGAAMAAWVWKSEQEEDAPSGARIINFGCTAQLREGRVESVINVVLRPAQLASYPAPIRLMDHLGKRCYCINPSRSLPTRRDELYGTSNWCPPWWPLYVLV